MLKKVSPVVIAVVCLMWIALITGFYYLYHKPFSADFAIRLLQGSWQWICALVVISICGGLGRRILLSYGGTPVTNGFIQFTLGFGVAATLVLVIGLLGYIRITFPILTLIALVFLRKQTLAWWRDIMQTRSIWQDSDRYEKVILAIVLILASASSLAASAPAIHYDALTYHLALPATDLQHGQIINLPDAIRAGMAQLGEMLYLWTASLGGLISAAITGWLVGFAAIVALFTSIKQAINHRAAVIGVAALAAGTSVMAALSWAYIDWFCLVFGLAGLISLAGWAQTGNRRDILLAGLFTGFAIACKLTAGVFALGAVLWVVVHSFRQKQNFFKSSMEYLVAAFLPVLPWLVKNWAGYGNPFYPYLFSSEYLDAGRVAMLQTQPAFGNWMDIVLLPFRATTIGLEGMAGYSHAIGPLMLILGIFAWLKVPPKGENPNLLSAAKWLGVTGLLIWVAANQFNGILVQTRLYYVLFPAFIVLAAVGYHALSSLNIPRLDLKWLVSSFILLALVLAAIQNVNAFIQTNALSYLTGSMTRKAYLEHNLGWYAAAMERVKELPDGERTLLIYEPRGLYCQPACAPDELLDQWSYSLSINDNDPTKVLVHWRDEGFQYLLVYQTGIDFFMQGSDPNHSLADLAKLENTLAPLTIVENFGESYVLYRLE